MPVLVDSSVWINYFKNKDGAEKLDYLIDENLIVINDIILTELIPFLTIKKETQVINLLQQIKKIPLEIEWDKIIKLQVQCLKSGANGVGIADLIIAQNAVANNCKVYSLDKHFKLISKLNTLELIDE